MSNSVTKPFSPDISTGMPYSTSTRTNPKVLIGTNPKASTGQSSRPLTGSTPSPPPRTTTQIAKYPEQIPKHRQAKLQGHLQDPLQFHPPKSRLYLQLNFIIPISVVGVVILIVIGTIAYNDPDYQEPTFIIPMSVVGVMILILISILVYKYWQNKRQKNRDTSDGVGKTLLISSTASRGDSKIEIASTERLIEEFSKDKPMRFSPSDLIAFTRNYSHQLGSGGFGVVYKGEMYNGVLVAVKVLKKISDSIVNEQFVAELCSVGRTYHINLVKLYGFCFENDMKALIYEYMENGSLESCLADRCKLDWEKLYQIAIGTARGIRYLHEECHKMIIHYDIKPGNVLLSQNFSPKVADFGMAELWDRESTLQTVTQGRGTPGFIAPELSRPLSVTHKCDVYSYGMLLFQIVGSRRIMEGKQADSLQISAYWVLEKAGQGEFVSIMSSCGIEEKDRLKAKRMCEVALTCVQLQPENRPSMSTILIMLESEKDICVQSAGSKPEPYSNVASGDLGGSKPEASSESGGSKSEKYNNVIFDELGGSNAKAFGELGDSKSEVSGAGGSKSEQYNNVTFDELGGSKSKASEELSGSKSEFFDEFGGSKPKASDELVSGDLGDSKPEAFGELFFGDLGGSKSKPCESNSNSQTDVNVGSPPAKQVTSN